MDPSLQSKVDSLLKQAEELKELRLACEAVKTAKETLLWSKWD